MPRTVPVLVSLVVALLSSACGSPSSPSAVKSLTIATPAPASGSSIPVVQRGIQYFADRNAGLISIPITVTSDREVPWAQLKVYLYSDTDTGQARCGDNAPDAPTWGPFSKGQTATVTITGFQISRVPCHVTSIRAYLHTRNSGLNTPPTTSETVVDGSLAVNYTFVAAP